MANKENVTSNIQDNHTLGEYQRYFSHLLAKGKLKRFSLSEKDKLNPNRQYWKITDDKGKTYYYELPKYIKPGSDKSAYSMSRVMHRRPARIALAIFAGVAIASFTSMAIGKSLQSGTPDVPPQPLPDPKGLFKVMKEFRDWKEANPDADATSKYTVAELVTIGMANTLYDDTKYEETTATYPRRPLLTVGYGNTITYVVIEVRVDVSNSFTYKDGNALEESISFSSSGLAPQVARRDFYIQTSDDDGKVESNTGTAVSSKTMKDDKWSDEIDRQYDTKDAYEADAGKTPDNPFLYSIDEDTILSDSTVTKIENGYSIDINLDPSLGTARYKLRMNYLSGKTPKFKSVQLNFITDESLHFISSTVKESYAVPVEILGYVDTVGNLTTAFYYDNVPDILDRTTPFDYSKYPA